MKTISYTEAFELYLKSGLEDIMPFDSETEYSFIQYLQDKGLLAIDNIDYEEL